MGSTGVCPPAPGLLYWRSREPLAVVGITHSQTCLVLRGRIRALREAGFRVILISNPGVLLDQFAVDEGVEKLPIPMERGIAPLADALSLFRLWRALRRLHPRITEFSTPKAGLLGNVAAALCGVPYRIYMLRGLRLETASGLRRKLLKASEWVASVCAHAVVCNSDSLRREATALGLAPGKKLRLVANGSSNGVDAERFCPGPDAIRAGLGIPAGVPVIGFVGRLTCDKGIPTLLDAFEELLKAIPAARLLLVGWFDDSEDALGPAERARIRSHPRILATGFVADTAPWYRAIDLLVLPTLREGFPNVILEAAASGVPAITTMVTGARDAVVNERTGLLVQPGDSHALARAILRLIESPAIRLRLGTAAREWVVEQFEERRILRMTQDLYRELLQAGETRPATALPQPAPAPAD